MGETKSGVGNLALEVGFGVWEWGRLGRLSAKYFRSWVATFVVAILYFSLAPYLPSRPILLVIGIYLACFLARQLLPARFEMRFYHPAVQLLRAQLGLWALFFLLWLTRTFAFDSQSLLWLLYLPLLLIISRHHNTVIYILHVGQVCLMIMAVRWGNDSLQALVQADFSSDFLSDFPFADPILIVRCLSLLLLAFVSHYLLRNIVARDYIIQMFTTVDMAEPVKTQRRAKSLASLHHISWQVALGHELTEVLAEVGQSLKTILAADIVMLYRYDRAENLLAYPHIFGEIIDKPSLRLPSLDEGLVAAILTSREPYYAPYAQNDPLLVDLAPIEIEGDEGDGEDRSGRTFAQRQGVVSFAGVPMIANGIVVGVLCVNYRTYHPFSEDERQMLEIASQFAAMALYNVETNKLAEEVIVSRERAQLALRLHHSLSQYLPAIRMMAETAEVYLQDGHGKAKAQLAKIELTAIKAAHEMRENINALNSDGLAGLRPLNASADGLDNIRDLWIRNTQSLRGNELQTLLESEVQSMRNMYNLMINLQLQIAPHQDIPSSIGQGLLVVWREGLANAGKHAGARRVDLKLIATPQQVCFSICDDGCGFDPAHLKPQKPRGLAMLQTHIGRLNGQVSIDSRPGAGTTIRGEIPI